jgi:hypothetical protein
MQPTASVTQNANTSRRKLLSQLRTAHTCHTPMLHPSLVLPRAAQGDDAISAQALCIHIVVETVRTRRQQRQR